MDISERKRVARQKLARMIARESNAMQRDRLRSVLLVLQGRQTLEVTATGRSKGKTSGRSADGSRSRLRIQWDPYESSRRPRVQRVRQRRKGS